MVQLKSADNWALITGCPNGFSFDIATELARSSYNVLLHGEVKKI